MSKKNSRPGRPTEGRRRKGRTNITLDPEVEDFIDELGSQFNVSGYCNRALWALKSQSSDEARLHSWTEISLIPGKSWQSWRVNGNLLKRELRTRPE